MILYEVHLDYDNLSLQEVEKDLRRLMQKFNLKKAWIYQSSEGKHYHVFLRPPLSREKMLEVVDSSKCHREYKKQCKKWGECAIRVNRSRTKPEPKYVKSLTIN